MTQIVLHGIYYTQTRVAPHAWKSALYTTKLKKKKWDKTPGTDRPWYFLADKVGLCFATRTQAWTMIRTCNIKACGFQRLSFTANFRSPGSYVPRQLIKSCFHPHLPVQHPKASLATTGLLLSKEEKKKPWYEVWISLQNGTVWGHSRGKMLSCNSAAWPC